MNIKESLIIAIVADSGSGKTFASMFLAELMGWKQIVSYTTRPMREGEFNGKDHWFVDANQMPSKDIMCAYAEFAGHIYWITWEQFTENKVNLYVVEEIGLMELKNMTDSPVPFKLLSIKLNRKDKADICSERLGHDIERTSLPDDWYDFIIDNDGTLEQFKNKLAETATLISRML